MRANPLTIDMHPHSEGITMTHIEKRGGLREADMTMQRLAQFLYYFGVAMTSFGVGYGIRMLVSP